MGQGGGREWELLKKMTGNLNFGQFLPFFNDTRILSKKFWEMSKKLQLFGVREGVK